jgi:hypothetical protein
MSCDTKYDDLHARRIAGAPVAAGDRSSERVD